MHISRGEVRKVSIANKFAKLKWRLLKGNKPSLGDIHGKLQKYLDFDSGFFIEAGANNGYIQSNTFYLEKSRRWRGVLVEGIPELYQECLRNRPDSLVVNCALVSDEYEGDSVLMHFADLMSMVDGAMNDVDAQAKHLSAGVLVQKLDSSYEVSVPARTLTSVLDAAGVSGSIDFFSLDVEGYELQVLCGLDTSKYRPKYILVEIRDFEGVNSWMTSNSYKFVEKISGHDYLYSAADRGTH